MLTIFDGKRRKGTRVAARLVILRKPRSILRKRAYVRPRGECPEPVPAHMADVEHPYDPPRLRAVCTYGRGLALARAWDLAYADDEDDPAARVRFAAERARCFDLREPARVLLEEEEEREVKPAYDPMHTAAATVVDQVLHSLERGGDGDAAAVLGRALARNPLLEKEAVRGEAIIQAQDLLERCAARSEALGALGGPQHDVRAELNRRGEARAWTEAQDADYIERAARRVPDALTQRYLLTRTVSRTVGLDATPRTAALLERVMDALGGAC